MPEGEGNPLPDSVSAHSTLHTPSHHTTSHPTHKYNSNNDSKPCTKVNGHVLKAHMVPVTLDRAKAGKSLNNPESSHQNMVNGLVPGSHRVALSRYSSVLEALWRDIQYFHWLSWNHGFQIPRGPGCGNEQQCSAPLALPPPAQLSPHPLLSPPVRPPSD